MGKPVELKRPSGSPAWSAPEPFADGPAAPLPYLHYYHQLRQARGDPQDGGDDAFADLDEAIKAFIAEAFG